MDLPRDDASGLQTVHAAARGFSESPHADVVGMLESVRCQPSSNIDRYH